MLLSMCPLPPLMTVEISLSKQLKPFDKRYGVDSDSFSLKVTYAYSKSANKYTRMLVSILPCGSSHTDRQMISANKITRMLVCILPYGSSHTDRQMISANKITRMLVIILPFGSSHTDGQMIGKHTTTSFHCKIRKRHPDNLSAFSLKLVGKL